MYIKIELLFKGEEMFGYIKIHKDELLVREYEAYKSVYCGLCKKLGKEYTFLSRFILSYDSTFYAIFLMSQNYKCTGFERKRCTCNPLKKCTFCKGGDEALSKAAALSVILSYYKLEDDVNDSKFFKRALIKLIKPVFSCWRKKAAKRFPIIDMYAKEMLYSQFEAEKNKDCCLDMAAEPTAKLLSNILSIESEDKTLKAVYEQFGYHIGRWIYLMDAVDDLRDDIKKHNFNPLMLLREEERNTESYRIILSRCLAQAFNAYNLIDITDFKGILNNIILKGLPLMQEKVLKGKKGDRNERSV